MGAAPHTPTYELLATSSQGPQVVQDMEGKPDDPALCLLKDFIDIWTQSKAGALCLQEQ